MIRGSSSSDANHRNSRVATEADANLLDFAGRLSVAQTKDDKMIRKSEDFRKTASGGGNIAARAMHAAFDKTRPQPL